MLRKNNEVVLMFILMFCLFILPSCLKKPISSYPMNGGFASGPANNSDNSSSTAAVLSPSSNKDPYNYSEESKAYKAVLDNKIMFHNYIDDKNTFLDDVFNAESAHINDLGDSITYFTIIDLDDDGIQEVVFRYSNRNDTGVLHYNNGKVYGFFIGIRAFNSHTLKTDGIFMWSNSAVNSGYSRVEFTGDSYKIIDLGHEDIDGWMNDIYYIGDKKVTMEEYNTYFDNREDVTWYEFTPMNLGSQLP